MASTPAERQRRSRAHKVGDHSLCDPARCEAVTVARDVTPVVTRAPSRPRTSSPSPRFGSRGERLWQELSPGRGPAEIVLIEEACRLADRLDRLDAVLAGDQMTWMELRGTEDGPTVIVVDAVLSQARMHATTLRGIVTELRQSAGANAGAPASQGASFLDQLAARRAQRLTNPAG